MAPASTVYEERLRTHRQELERLERRHIRIGNIQIGLITLIVVVALLALVWRLLSILWLLGPLTAILALAVLHERALRRHTRVGRVVGFYQYALDRVQDRWAGKGETGDRFLDSDHPYAKDLDLFGRGSLFEYLSTARTRAGEETLARWLLSSSELGDVRDRHDAICELGPQLGLREEIAVVGEDIRAGVHPEALAAWGEEASRLLSRRRWALATILSVLGASSLILWITAGVASPFLAVFVVARVFSYRLRQDVDHLVESAAQPGRDLRLLAEALVVLERQRFRSPRLAEIHAALSVDGHAPSRRIARLYRLLELLDSRDNLLLRVIDPIMLWTHHVAFAVETWRRRSGPHLRGWLAAVGEMEALLALAGYHYEHPADPFPEFTDEPPCFDGEGLAHPLIPEARAIRNDLRLDGGLRVLVVSGSNMSGKSTLLRTVGVNAVLAMAGAPVRATRLRISRLAIGASIRTVDSLQSGASRFYAEITRLKQIVELAGGAGPLLFLLDELLHGTNSHDRGIGAKGIVDALVARGTIGLLTTHDLALAKIADALTPLAANAHFQDQMEDGRMVFDYRLRPGVVEHSNALELMRSVGLDV